MVIVFGSINLDLIFSLANIPRPGETVIDATFGAGGHSALLSARLRGVRETLSRR